MKKTLRVDVSGRIGLKPALQRAESRRIDTSMISEVTLKSVLLDLPRPSDELGGFMEILVPSKWKPVYMNLVEIASFGKRERALRLEGSEGSHCDIIPAVRPRDVQVIYF